MGIVFSKHRSSGPMLSISQFARPSVRPCVCSLAEVPFKRFFAPTSQSQMSKTFRHSESFGKSNGKKCSQIWKLLLMKGVKSHRKKVCFWANFVLLSRIFLVLVFLTPFNGLFSPTSQSPMSKLFRFLKSLGKSNAKKWSQIWKL